MELSACFSNIEIAPPSHFQGLTMFPLRSPSVAPPGYLTLAEATAAGCVSILEKGVAGTVSEVRIVNESPHHILILEGEEIMGAKQNRTVNLTILLQAKSGLDVPVTCVEAGRWDYRTQEFHVSGECHFAKARRKKQMSVTFSMRSHGERAADQTEVWEDIREKMEAMSVDSPTSAMHEVFERHGVGLQEYLDALPSVEGQTGAAFAIGPRMVGLDLFDSAATWGKMHARLLRSYAIDALEEHPEGRPDLKSGNGESILGRLAACAQTAHGALGLGIDLRLSGQGMHGAALVWNGRLIHLSAFWDDNGRGRQAQGDARIVRSSRRRNLRS